MRLRYDKYNRVEPFRIYIGTLDNKKVCCLNGIQPESVNLKLNLNNTYELSFTVDKYISYFGKRYISNGYEWLGTFARLHVENIGWFIMNQPEINNDGISETKEVKAESCEIEFAQRDLVGFKINCGTTDSYEMLDPNNVEVDEYTGVEFAKEQIKFHNPNNPKLSLLDILINESGMTDWTVGYVDTIAKKYTEYVDGNLVEREVLLADEIPYFDIDTKSVYGILTQEVSKYFECLILFDINNKQINAYRVENVGKDTNIHIGFRNLQNTNSISVDESSIFTRFNVRGGDDLNIRYINFGLDQIENIEYFLNTKYLPEELIEKYKLWLSDVESVRYDYINLSRKYNEQLEIISELKDRVPLDACSTDWDSFSLDELQQKKQDYEAQKLAIEKMFTDADGVVDYDALQASDLASDYNQIVNVIIPNIETAIWNKDIVSEDDKRDSIEDTDWTHYGLYELYAKMQLYEGQRSALTKSGYNVPWTEESNNAQDYHEARYQEYLELCNQLDPTYVGSCAEAYEQRKQEVTNAETLRDQYSSQRQEIASSVQKETWKHHSSINESEYKSFSDKDLELLNKLYYDTDYVNDNMFLVSSDTQVTAIDEQQKLYDAAINDLSSTSQPQFKYSTSLDNFLAITQYSDFSKELDVGNYMRLDIRDDYQVKLRVISISFNPMVFDNDLDIEFSNMIKSKSKRTDMDSLLNSANNISKNQISGNSNGSSMNIDDTTMRAILNKLLGSSALNNKINSSVAINGGGGGSSSGSQMTLSELETKLKKLIDLDTGDGFFNYLQAELISTGKIVADSGDFKNLSALVAMIDNLLAGNISAELGHIISLTADNVSISEAVIKDLIAAQITVSMLKAGDISTDTFHIVSDDGGVEIAGNTMQFKDANDVIRIQIGRDANNEFTFCLYDETGEGVLIDSTGVHESAIADGLIVNNMVADGTLEKNKFAFDVLEGDGNGNLDAGKVLVDGHGVDVEFTSIKNTITETNSKIDNLTSQIASIELMGEQIFKQIQGVVSPETITVTAVCRNGATIGDWYINDVLVTDTEYVSDDKMSITIPSSYMLDNNIVPIKVTDSTGELYDLHTLYLISDSTGAKGDDAYTVILQNENVSFSVDNSSNTVLSDQSYSSTVQIFQGTTERTDFTIGEINSANGITISVQDKTVILSVKNGDKITENNGFFTVPILIDDLTFYKDITWNLAKQGETGSSGEPSLNIVVGNESQNIPCSNEGLALENFLIEIPFTGYKGFDRVGCSVSVGLLPDGVTLGSNTASTPDTEGLIILNVSKDATLGGASVLNGKVTLTFTIDGKNMSRYFTWVKTKDGAEGSMILYELVSSSPVLNKNYDDTLSPPTITFNSYYRQSNSTDKTSYAGQFIIAESDNDGATYTNKYLSTAVEDFVEYTPSSASITNIRCILCSAEDISIELDVLTVPVLTDVNSIKPIIAEITTTMSGVQTQVDAVEKSITDKVWQDDITNSISNYDSTTTESIRSRVSQVEQDVNGIKSTVSDVQTTLTEKADGSTVMELSEKVSTLEQNADGFKQTVEKNYVAKIDLNISSRNLLRNSKTLIFDSYGLVNGEGIIYLIDESGNILTDENDNMLIL